MTGCVEVSEDVRSRAEAIGDGSEAPKGELRFVGLDEVYGISMDGNLIGCTET